MLCFLSSILSAYAGRGGGGLATQQAADVEPRTRVGAESMVLAAGYPILQVMTKKIPLPYHN
jgi:hypothetical protein